MTDFTAELERRKQQVENALLSALPGSECSPATLHGAMRYSIEAGGKRLRPIILMAAAELYPNAVDPLPAAVAVELLHTYTLVHDDLPAMDNSPLRRGRPSVHVAYDEATAVLVGDALLTRAFEVLATGYASVPQIGLPLVHELSRAAGSRHLIGGQAEDTAAENRQITAEELDFIHLNKTAALLEACGRLGLICGDAPAEDVAHMTAALRAVGLAFQIQDDILDTTSSEAVLGKTVGADAANAKNTYVAFHGLENSRARATSLTGEALSHLARISGDTRFLKQLFEHLLTRRF